VRASCAMERRRRARRNTRPGPYSKMSASRPEASKGPGGFTSVKLAGAQRSPRRPESRGVARSGRLSTPCTRCASRSTPRRRWVPPNPTARLHVTRHVMGERQRGAQHLVARVRRSPRTRRDTRCRSPSRRVHALVGCRCRHAAVSEGPVYPDAFDAEVDTLTHRCLCGLRLVPLTTLSARPLTDERSE
jgi:hypothetical protein